MRRSSLALRSPCEEAFDVLRVMREGEQVSLDGFRMLDVKVRTIFETTEPMEQAFIPVARR